MSCSPRPAGRTTRFGNCHSLDRPASFVTAKLRVLFCIEHPGSLLYFTIFVGPKEGLMGKAVKNGFNPKLFLAKVGAGKTISNYRKDQTIFAQGDVADTIFYVQKGKVKIVVISDQGKEAVVGI